MTTIRRSGAQIALLVLSIIGVVISIYLTTVHYQGAPLVCSTSGIIDCSRVLSSPYSVVPGTTIPISIPGLFWFVIAGVIAGLMLRKPEVRAPRLGMLIWTVLGLSTVFYLIYVEIVILHTICIWCTSLHVIIFIMLLISVTQLQASELDEDEYEDEDEALASIPNVVRK
jgi:uncharacterized membrane protein